METMLDLVIASTAFAVACFTLVLLCWQDASQARQPLVAVLLGLAFFSAGPLVFQLFPSLIQIYVSLSPVALFLYLAVFWFYHQALISNQRWRWRRAMLRHFLPLPFALLLGASIMALPAQDFARMFFSDEPLASDGLTALSLVFFVAIIAWCLLSGFYVVGIITRTINLRRRLNDVYSDRVGRDLRWFAAVAALTIVVWGYGLFVLVFEDRFWRYGLSETGVLVLLAVLVWTLCLNGLRQRPVFEAVQGLAEFRAEEQGKKTYERSTLDQDDLQRIARKLATAISKDRVHLLADLNLAKLSALVGERAQYISQTLSQHLDTTFFDYINQARISDARRMLVETDASVLNVAFECGFNSRSSFYKAFRQLTHTTPGQYRHAHR